MATSNLLLAGNLLFIQIDYNDSLRISKDVKYKKASINGLLLGDITYTYTEIITKYPDIKHYSGFGALCKDRNDL